MIRLSRQSTIVSDREQAAYELLTTLERHSERVGARLAEIFSPLLEEGETLPDYVLMQTLMARAVRSRLGELLTADAAHLSLLRQMSEYRKRGLEGMAEVCARLEELRQAGGCPGLSSTVAETPQDAEALEARATAVLSALDDHSARLPAAWSRAESETWTAAVRPALRAVRWALAEQPFLRARLAKTQMARWQAVADFDQTYSGFARVLEALYGLAGEEADGLHSRLLDNILEERQADLAAARLAEQRQEDDGEDPIERRMLSRKSRRPGLSRWLGVRIFRRHRRRRTWG